MGKHLFYVSTTLPTPGFGSSVIIYKHLLRLKGWKITIISHPQVNIKYQLPDSWNIISIPEKGKWLPPIHNKVPGSLRLRLKILKRQCEYFLKGDTPSAILNQLGKNSLLAYYLSKSWKVPLSLIVHDRYEVWAKTELDRRMTKKQAQNILNHASRVWFASQELGNFYRPNNPKKICILSPIPEGNPEGFVQWREDFENNPVIACAGSFHSPQIIHFKNIAKVLQKMNGKLMIVTKKNNLIKPQLKDFSNVEYREPFAENKDIIHFLASNASCILVPESIDPRAVGSSLSFPSRLVEFSHLGLPIVIIASAGTALANWANKHNWRGYLESSEAPDLSTKINMLLAKNSWEKMAEQSRNVAMNEFDPERIQSQFVAELAVAEGL